MSEKRVQVKKKKEICGLLIDNFVRMNMDKPSNFDEIADFVYEDVEASADKVNWTDMDVIIAFRRWIESKAKQQ